MRLVFEVLEVFGLQFFERVLVQLLQLEENMQFLVLV
jgi:hypothetical protein